ncbi:hypothetical protein HMN09_00792700 [Mycena chlorophos]|uniref:F-box domain-containing protein n=1 Tax=Mycena chlorophos TaxID=658473 RepID=A0A8H6W8D2_MYCCL|nr:hypothetical protein HMN09_00792700 [Mycena chlorophos]
MHFGDEYPQFSRPVFPDSRHAASTKLALALVNRAWYDAAIDFLYRSIILRDVDQLVALVHTLRQRPQLGQLVRRLGLNYRVIPEWETLVVAEVDTLMELCPAVSSVSLGWPQNISVPRLVEIDWFHFPLHRATLTSADITSLEIHTLVSPYAGGPLQYPDIFLVLSALAPTLEELSLAVPDDFGTIPSQIVFPRIHKLRLLISRDSQPPTAAWAFPALRTLAVAPTSPDMVFDVDGRAAMSLDRTRAIVAQYGANLVELTLPFCQESRDGALSEDSEVQIAQKILDLCPRLRRFGMSIHLATVCSAGTPQNGLGYPIRAFVHPNVEVVHWFGSRAGLGSVYFVPRELKAAMPRLRAYRWIPYKWCYIADDLDSDVGLQEFECVSGDDAEPVPVPVAKILPTAAGGTWLELLFSDSVFGIEEESDEDPDWEPSDSESEASVSESDDLDYVFGTGDSDSEDSDDSEFWDSGSEIYVKNGDGAEEEEEEGSEASEELWVMGREEALEIFANLKSLRLERLRARADLDKVDGE